MEKQTTTELFDVQLGGQGDE